jgi:hypothetical protein
MLVVSVLLLGALGFGLYQCRPVRTHVRNVLVGQAEQARDEPAPASTDAGESEQTIPEDDAAETSAAQ